MRLDWDVLSCCLKYYINTSISIMDFRTICKDMDFCYPMSVEKGIQYLYDAKNSHQARTTKNTFHYIDEQRKI